MEQEAPRTPVSLCAVCGCGQHASRNSLCASAEVHMLMLHPCFTVCLLDCRVVLAGKQKAGMPQQHRSSSATDAQRTRSVVQHVLKMPTLIGVAISLYEVECRALMQSALGGLASASIV
jgi:hypothetical protein